MQIKTASVCRPTWLLTRPYLSADCQQPQEKHLPYLDPGPAPFAQLELLAHTVGCALVAQLDALLHCMPAA